MCQWGNGLLLRPNRGFQPFPAVAPLDAGWRPRTATPWGTALDPATTVPLYAPSVQVAADGSIVASGSGSDVKYSSVAGMGDY